MFRKEDCPHQVYKIKAERMVRDDLTLTETEETALLGANSRNCMWTSGNRH